MRLAATRAGGYPHAGPNPQRVVALALARGKPTAIHADDLELCRARILESDITHRRPRTVREVGQRRLEIGERLRFLAVEGADEGAVRNAGAAEHVAGIRHIHALDRQVVVPRLLIGERVHDGFAELDVLIGGDGAQRLHLERMAQGFVAALDLHFDLLPDMIVEHILQREELRHRFAVDRHQDVARRQHAVRGRSRLHFIDHQHSGELRIGAAHTRFGRGFESEAPQFVIGRVLEHGFQRAARHRLAGIDVLQRAGDRGQRQIEARGGAGGAAGIQAPRPVPRCR